MAYTPTADTGSQVSGGFGGRLNKKSATMEKSKTVSYGTTNQIYKISSTAAADASNELMPTAVEVENTGMTPVTIMTGYETYSGETAGSGATRYLHNMLMPGEIYQPPVRAVISTEAASTQFDGTVVSNTAPDGNMYTEFSDGVADIDSATAAGIVGHATNTTVYLEPYTTAANCSANLFRVGDLIRVRDEVMEVTAIGAKAALATNTLTVKRDMYGTDGGTAAVDNDNTRLPFFNAYHDYDKYSVAQTDSNGKFKCFNFFGLGRAATGNQGIVPGSVAIKFYESGYQGLGLSGITSGTDSALTASGSYWFKIAIDGGTAESINFTVDSSNTNFGGTNGIISKIQAALDDKYKNTASNTFEQKSTVGIVNGDLRFTSGSHLSTSAIALTAGVDGASASYNIFAQQNGRFPALANIRSAVAAKLPDDVSYDRVTYTTSPNNVFCYDDGYGNLLGKCTGKINYETGAIDMTGAPVNAEFVYSVAHTSAFSGKLAEAGTGRINGLIEILANTSNQKQSGSVKLRTY